MRIDEIEIVRAVSVKLDDDTVFFLTYQYHTEKDPSDPSGRKNNKAKSRYRMLGRVMKIEDIDKASADAYLAENRMKPWVWPDDPSWNGNILYAKDATNRTYSSWLRTKVRKAVNWETYVKIINGYKRDVTKNRAKFARHPQDMYTVYNPNAVYVKSGYTCTDGDTVDIMNREQLLSKTGQNVWCEIQMKLVGPGKNSEN